MFIDFYSRKDDDRKFINETNLKVLNNYKKQFKDIIKLSSKKIKSLDKEIKDIKKKLSDLNEEKDKILSKIKRNKLLLCKSCYGKFRNNKEFNNHRESINRYGWFKSIVCKDVKNRDENLVNVDIQINRMHSQKNYLSYQLEENVKIVEKYESKYELLMKVIEGLKKKCHKCKVHNIFLENCGCKSNHLLCDDCFDAVEDKCPICIEIITFENCPICRRNKNELIDVKCGNGHKICSNCYEIILKKDSCCPFCRCSI